VTKTNAILQSKSPTGAVVTEAHEPSTGTPASTDYLKDLLGIAREELEAQKATAQATTMTTAAVNDLRDKIQVRGVS
jgi:hypothetical protein